MATPPILVFLLTSILFTSSFASSIRFPSTCSFQAQTSDLLVVSPGSDLLETSILLASQAQTTHGSDLVSSSVTSPLASSGSDVVATMKSDFTFVGENQAQTYDLLETTLLLASEPQTSDGSDLVSSPGTSPLLASSGSDVVPSLKSDFTFVEKNQAQTSDLLETSLLLASQPQTSDRSDLVSSPGTSPLLASSGSDVVPSMKSDSGFTFVGKNQATLIPYPVPSHDLQVLTPLPMLLCAALSSARRNSVTMLICMISNFIRTEALPLIDITCPLCDKHCTTVGQLLHHVDSRHSDAQICGTMTCLHVSENPCIAQNHKSANSHRAPKNPKESEMKQVRCFVPFTFNICTNSTSQVTNVNWVL